MEEINVIVVDYNRTFLVLQYIDPVTGKRKTKSSKTAKRKEAEKRGIEWQTELRHGLYKEPSKLTWDEFRERYEQGHVAELRPNSRKSIDRTFNAIEDVMSPKRLQQINSQWVTNFKRLVGDGVAIDTVNLHLRNLKAAMNWAKSQKMVSEVPAIKQIKRGKSSKQMKGRPITAEEFERILDAVKSLSSIGCEWAPDWERFLKGLWWSGLRISEAVGLTWDEWSDGIRATVSDDGYVFLLISGEDEKGGKDRVYPVAPEFAEMLLSVPEDKRTGYVFDLPQKGGKRASVLSEVGRKISDVGKLAGVKVNETLKSGKTVTKFASSHDFRRAFGVRWSRRIFPAELMELMRHENIETTMKYYVGQQAELTAKKLYEALNREREHNTSHNTTKKTTSEMNQEVAYR